MEFSLLLILFHVHNDVKFSNRKFLEEKKRRRKILTDAALWISHQKVGHVGNNLGTIATKSTIRRGSLAHNYKRIFNRFMDNFPQLR